MEENHFGFWRGMPRAACPAASLSPSQAHRAAAGAGSSTWRQAGSSVGFGGARFADSWGAEPWQLDCSVL